MSVVAFVGLCLSPFLAYAWNYRTRVRVLSHLLVEHSLPITYPSPAPEWWVHVTVRARPWHRPTPRIMLVTATWDGCYGVADKYSARWSDTGMPAPAAAAVQAIQIGLQRVEAEGNRILMERKLGQLLDTYQRSTP